MSNLEGKVAVVTGGTSGIGLATARRFVREGAHVFITGRRQSELDKAKAELGANVTAIQGDVASLADLDRLYAAVKAEKGVVDIVVANAGFIEHAGISDLSETHFDRTMDINLKGVVFTVQKALPLMTRGGGPSSSCPRSSTRKACLRTAPMQPRRRGCGHSCASGRRNSRAWAFASIR